jgi:hypothetical protein
VSYSGTAWVFGGELDAAQFATYSALAGGVKSANNRGTLSGVLALQNNVWRSKKRMPEAKQGIMPVQSGGYVYVCGGFTASTAGASATCHKALLSALAACDETSTGAHTVRCIAVLPWCTQNTGGGIGVARLELSRLLP